MYSPQIALWSRGGRFQLSGISHVSVSNSKFFQNEFAMVIIMTTLKLKTFDRVTDACYTSYSSNTLPTRSSTPANKVMTPANEVMTVANEVMTPADEYGFESR